MGHPHESDRHRRRLPLPGLPLRLRPLLRDALQAPLRLASRWPLRLPLLLLGALALWGASPAPAAAGVLAQVDLSSQRMTVWVDGIPRYSWPVSTARRGYVTPTGTYRPQSLHRTYYSRKYDNSPMPYAIFFRGGYAIHGSYATGLLGRRASHGCIRLAPGHAATLFSLVRSQGAGATLIRIVP